MPIQYTFPSLELIKHLVDVKTFISDDLVATKLLPIDTDTFANSPSAVTWDVLEPTRGLTSLSALDADPILINQRAIKTISAAPLYFKECVSIPESQLINMRKPGRNDVRDATDSVLRAIAQLSERVSALVEYANASALTGTLNIGHVSVDYGFATDHKPVCGTTSGYGPVWTSANSATPIEDLRRAAKTIYGTGAREIEVYASLEAINTLLSTKEIKDVLIGTRNIQALSAEGFAEAAPAILGAGITKMILSNQYYADENGDPAAFFPSNKVFLVGRAPGVQLGCFASTPSLDNGGLDGAKGGPFVKTTDFTDRPRPEIIVTGGIYGLPVLYRPDMVTCLQISA